MDAVLELARVAIMRHWGGGRGEAPVRENAPVKGAGEDEVLVRAEFGEAFAEISLEDEAASFVYYEESEDNPRAKVRMATWCLGCDVDVVRTSRGVVSLVALRRKERNPWMQRLIDAVMKDRQAVSYRDHEGRIIIGIVVYCVV